MTSSRRFRATFGLPTRLGWRPSPQLRDPATIRLRRDDPDHVGDLVIELLTDRQQPGAVLRAGDNPVAAQLAAEDLDLSFQEADAGGAGFHEEVQSDVEPV